MPSSPLLYILLAVVAASFIFLVQAEGGWGELPRLLERAIQQTDKLPSAPTAPSRLAPSIATPRLDFTSGASRFSQGSCSQDAECQVSGCSSEVCGREAAITTCEYSEDFPNTKKFTCGCVQKKCGWQAK